MRSVHVLRRALRRALRRSKPSRTPFNPAILPITLLIFLILYHPPDSTPLSKYVPHHQPAVQTHFHQNHYEAIPAPRLSHLSRPLTPVTPSSSNNPSTYAPLRSQVDAIVGAGTGARDALVSTYLLPEIVVSNMTQSTASRLYWKLVYADVVETLRAHHHPVSSDARLPRFKPYTRVFFIHPQNGLGNRLRAMGSALALARATRRVPVVVWERDAHLGASFNDLFESDAYGSDLATVLYKDLIVMDSFPEWHMVTQRSDVWYPVNYMMKEGEGAKPNTQMKFTFPLMPHVGPYNWKDTMGGDVNIWGSENPEDNEGDGDDFKKGLITKGTNVYFKSAYTAVSYPKMLSKSNLIHRELRELQPSKMVLEIFNKINRTELGNAIGIHIRSRTLANDNVKVDSDCEYSFEGAERTDFWRSRSQLSIFTKKMTKLIKSERAKAGKEAKFFVAADDVEVIRQLETTFPGRIISVPRNCDDRGEGCVYFAMADLMCLSKTRTIYGSNWSSFTEAAARLGNKKVLLSGRHFGVRKRKTYFGKLSVKIWTRIAKTIRLTKWILRHMLHDEMPGSITPPLHCQGWRE
eukprot:GFKZ01003692.1.p1 GENE.GFKZ01003692.1~~GFKZ01003692.1.p1  ORF type:complete len:578 (-),score=52.01 GFKZ01003692.1:632-2365(-)